MPNAVDQQPSDRYKRSLARGLSIGSDMGISAGRRGQAPGSDPTILMFLKIIESTISSAFRLIIIWLDSSFPFVLFWIADLGETSGCALW